MKQESVLNVAIVGGGAGCKAIMDMIFSEKLSALRMRLIGVADINPNAVGFRYARSRGIFTTWDYRDLFKLEGLNLIVELTGREELANEIFRTKPEHVRLMGNVAARLFWDIFRIEEQRIAERKEAERVLREDGRFLRNVFDAIQDGITVVDCDFNIVRVNPWVEKICADRHPLLGRKCYEAYQIGTSPCPWCPGQGSAGASDKGTGIVPFKKEGGATRWLELSAFVLNNAEGRRIGVIEHMKEITQRRAAEERLRESEAQKRAILDASVDMIRYVDQDMRIIWANRRTSEELGMAPEAVTGKTCYQLFLNRSEPCEGCPTTKALVTGRVEHAIMQKPEFGNRRGPSYWDCYGVPMPDKSGGSSCLIQMTRDVTRQKIAEKELERKHNELQAINAVLLRMTYEYNLAGMCRVLQTMMGEIYPGFETWIFLLTPQRDAFYLPVGEQVEPDQYACEKAWARLRRGKLDKALLRLLVGKNVGSACSARRDDAPAVIRDLVGGFSTWMAVPITLEGRCHGLFVLGSSEEAMDTENELVFVEAVIRQVAGVLRYQVSKEIKEKEFQEQLAGPDRFMGMVGRSQPMQKIYHMIQSVADSSSTVLITGESGTGKELVARAIHRAGRYRDRPFVVAHCSSFVPTLVHSEIFGHEKGAFTGAVSQKRGRLERAQGGILFLDEVADLPQETQVLLLRFLQDKRFERVGGERILEADVRVIAATNKDMEKEMKLGRLREDFYYRLNVLPIRMPSLRERVADIPLLAKHFLKTYCLIEGKAIKGFETEALRFMMDYDWPGNVRELQNMVARCVVLCSRDRIGLDVLPDRVRSRAGMNEYALAENEKNLIVRVMRECNGNKHAAARLLHISRGTLYSKLKKYGLNTKRLDH
ncbi:MAG: sigma 54-interacting transcriptional regulator [Deltaproteobacteria bacterium]|nr:sigma 54-interacting transcriptional regulator [Deltaproteobacteria bacterium]